MVFSIFFADEQKKMSRADTVGQNNFHWMLGDENSEEKDVFPHDSEDNQPPAAPSDGQGGRGLNAAAQKALAEKRRRLKWVILRTPLVHASVYDGRLGSSF